MFKLIRLIAACGVAVVLAAPVAEARTAGEQRTAAALQLGFYNCYSRGYPIVYQGTAQLGSGGRYGWGYLDTANRRLKSPGWGTYRASGSKVTWAWWTAREALRRREGPVEVRGLGERREVRELHLLLQVLGG